MQKRRTHAVSAAATLAALALMVLSIPELDAQTSLPGAGAGGMSTWDTFRADLSVRQATVAAEGAPAGPAAPALTVGIERRLAGSRWRTTVTLQAIERPQIRGLATGPTVINPFEVVRMEYDEDGTPPRMYDRQGRLVRLPREADRRRLHTPATLAAGLPVLDSLAGRVGPPPAALTGHAWIDEVLAPLEKRDLRRARMEAQLGRPTGQVRGLDRFTAWVGQETHEVLVDPQTAVPVEINTTRSGQLIAHTTFAHIRDAAGVLVRRTMRSERALARAPGDRSVTEIALADIQLSSEGVR